MKDPQNTNEKTAKFSFDKPKVLHKVLLEEYEMLGLLTKTEAEQIRLTGENKKKEFNLLSEEALKIKFPNPAERTEESRIQFIARGKYRFKILEIIRQKIHAKNSDERPTGLCLSGGGIRSATFCLGILQGLAKNGLLDKFDYLSTVSGGGYIGSWFSAWLYREGNMDKVQSALSRSGGYPYLFGMEDFEINFTSELEDEPEKLKKLEQQLIELRDALIEYKDFFNREEINNLMKVPLPSVLDLNQNKGAKNWLKIFGKFLCWELNRIILSEECESEELKIEIERKLRENLKENKTEKRIKIKRDLIEKKLKGIVRPLDEFEHIEAPEITYLRSYSNFMSPRPGLFSIDTWTLIAIYLRNLLLNWMVFLPLIAALLLLPRLYYAFVNIDSGTLHYGSGTLLYFFWGLIIIAGIAAVTNIIAMRPTLSRFSWIDQHYKIDEIGSVISAEAKVRRWCWFPMLGAAFGITTCWIWTRDATHSAFLVDFLLKIPVGSFHNYFSYETEKFIGFILFYNLLFLGGFIIAHGLLFHEYRKQNKNISVVKKPLFPKFQIIKEFFVSTVSAVFGGSLLYLFAYLLEKFAHWTATEEIYINTIYVCFGPPLFLVTVLISVALFIGFARSIYDDMDREWLSRFAAWLLIVIVVWSAFSSVILFGRELFNHENLLEMRELIPISIIGSISGLITLILGFSRKSSATEDKDAKSTTSILLKFAPQIAAPVFAVFLIILISNGTYSLMNLTGEFASGRGFSEFVSWIGGFKELTVDGKPMVFPNVKVTLVWIILFIIIGSLMSWFININKFSLHAMYRERLIRAYLGASRTDDRLKTANSFTDLDDEDNVEMHKLRFQKPFHIVNVTLNLGRATNLRWQNRKASSFTISPFHCGSSIMGDGSGNYRDSEQYGYTKTNKKAITLGTAAAISGAAVSPNMGYYSMSSAVSFVMALFNVRLGWWLGNPGQKGNHTYYKSAPPFSPRLLWDEAFGDTSDTNPYIYLSDGGHFENLGLYEMVLRRCHFIVVCDAGEDSKFGFFDLGTAIHKIRVDMGIPIEFFDRKAPQQGRNCAIAEIKYSAVDGNVDNGFLIYIKPTLDGEEPIDVVNYKNINPDFPHETTGDEFYSETQFESYRSLGIHMISTICNVKGQEVCPSISNFKKNAMSYLDKKNGSASEQLNR